MLHKVFETNILVKDLEFSEEWNSRVTAVAKHHFTRVLIEKNGDYFEAGNDSVNLFSPENMLEFPELKDLMDNFVEGFFELASSYPNNKLSKEQISEMLSIQDVGRLPFMRKGDNKRIHSHEHIMAFGIFYLTDIDNKKDGGQLICYDPSFNTLGHFHSKKEFGIETKKHRMIVCPGHVWHEVTPYIGDDERFTIVVNLDSYSAP
jgi:hypothetical protein